jgi:predicted transcriptional regulator
MALRPFEMRAVDILLTAREIACDSTDRRFHGRHERRCTVTSMATREEYLAQSLSRRQPWLADGIGRRQWERRRRKAASRKRAGQRISNRAKGGGRPNKAPRAAVGPTDAASRSPAHKRTVRRDDENLLMRHIYAHLDAHGLTESDPRALTKAIHAIELPEPFKHMDPRGLIKIYRRARKRLPVAYDRSVALIEKWDKSYDRRKARDLVDRLVMAVGDRAPGIFDRIFDHVGQLILDHPAKKVRRVEYECERLEKDDYYLPQLRPLKADAIKEQVYAALADEPKTKRELARMFRKTVGAISRVGQRLRNEGQITTIWCGGQFMWARASTASRFIPARDAIVGALRKGPMTIRALAGHVGKAIPTVNNILHRHLLANGTVIRTKLGTYALVGTAPCYVPKGEAIVAALKNGPMHLETLAREIGSTPSSLPQFLYWMLVEGTIIRTKRGVYALPGSAPIYVPTSDAIISALSKKAMKPGPLLQHVNKLIRGTRSRGTITTVLRRLKKEGTVKQEQRYGEYRLLRRVRQVRRGKSVRRKLI